MQSSVSHHWRMFRRRMAEQAGQTLAEYALLLGGMAVAVLLSALLHFGDGITSAFGSAADCVQGTCVSDPGGGDSGENGDGDNGDHDDHHDDD